MFVGVARYQGFPWRISIKMALMFRGVVLIYCRPEYILALPNKCTVSWLHSLGTIFIIFLR